MAGEDPLDGVTEADPAELAVLAGAALGSAIITVGVERWLFRRGEARRAQGTRFAHTRQGLALGGGGGLDRADVRRGGCAREALEGLTFRLSSRVDEAGAQ